MITDNNATATQYPAPHVKMLVTLSAGGFIKRIPAAIYRSQHIGSEGTASTGVREADGLKLMVTAEVQDKLLLFTNRGRVFRLRCYEITEELSNSGKGAAVSGLLPIVQGERTAAMVAVSGFKADYFVVVATTRGEIKKSALENFEAVRNSTGGIAIDLEQGDEVAAAAVAKDEDEVILTTQYGQAIRFKAGSLRTSYLASGGVRGIKLEEGDALVGMETVIPEAYLLAVTVNGYGKISPLSEYSSHGRGGGGIKAAQVTRKTGNVAVTKVVNLRQQVTLVSKNGMVTSTPVKDEGGGGIRLQGRDTQGVMVMPMEEGDRVAAAAVWE